MTGPADAEHGGRPLRVLRLSPAIYRHGLWPVAFDPVGGLQMQVWRITEQLSKMGVVQTVLTSHIPGSPRRSGPFVNTTVRSVGPWLPQRMGRWFLNLGWFLGLLPELLLRAHRYDLVHVHFNHSVWCRLAVLAASMRGIPTVASMNTSLWGGLTDVLKQLGLPIRVPEFIERLALRAAKRVLALTEADVTRKALETHIDRAHFTVVPDAIDIKRFMSQEIPDHAAAQFRLVHKIPADACVVVYLGRISAEKGWDDLPLFLKQPALFPSMFLLICGDGPDRGKLEAALRRAERPDRWCITGFLSPDDVRIALRTSDALVLPSRREAFGGVLLEAMASELPAIAYGVGGIGEVAGHPPAVSLIHPGAKARLVEAVREVIESETIRTELISRGRIRVWDFSVEKVAEQTLAVYRSIYQPLC